MREIKFRARDPIDKCWVYSLDNGLYDFFYGIGDGQLDDETLGEFTSFKDKKGKEIWEGDIIKCERDERIAEVFFGGGCFSYKDKRGNHGELGNIWSDNLEIIGNIYENPELLKEK